MSSDIDNSITNATKGVHSTAGKASAIAKEKTNDLGQISTDAIDKARAVVVDTAGKLSSAYNDNPTRVLAVLPREVVNAFGGG